MTRRFTGQELRDTVYGDGFDVISDEITSHSRWSVWHEMIFKVDDKFYRADYEKGATEYQETRPFENDDFVDCVEVVPVEKIIIIYEEK